MRFSVVTIFPEMFESVLGASLIGKACDGGLITVDFTNPRDFTSDRHRSVDDVPYGGGHGMVMKVGPLVAAIESLGTSPPPHRVLLSPTGAPLTQRRVRELASMPHIALVCGRYEGVDERVTEIAVDETISLGDFVMTGGELGAMAIIDAVARFVPGVLGEPASAEEESFADDLLEYPHYTRPASVSGLEVPPVLQSGHHQRIEDWRRAQSVARTAVRRPDLLRRHLTDRMAELAARTFVILAHHPVLDRDGLVVTSSVTNLDIHDIARVAATYGLGGYLPVSPVSLQRDKIDRIVAVWRDEIRQTGAENRGEALATVSVQPGIEAALTWIQSRAGARPRVVATSARRIAGRPAVDTAQLLGDIAAEPERPTALLFGTGWGLAPDAISLAEQVLEPIRGPSEFNHLPVRSAVAITLDRLFASGSGGPGRKAMR